MTTYQLIGIVLAGIGPVLALVNLAKLPASLALFGIGVASTFVPGATDAQADPKLVLTLFLPPLLYASTVRVSWHLLRFTFLPGTVLGVLLAIATIAAAAFALRSMLLPGISLTAAILIGAIAATFDTRLFHEAKGRPHVPRALADTLKARELVTRMVIFAAVSLAIETAGADQIAAWPLLRTLGIGIPAGVAVGALVGFAVVLARRRIDPAPVEIAVSVATPYAAALAATALGISVVASVTTAALVVSAVQIDRTTGVPISSAEARVSATTFWEEVSLLISSGLFFLAGRAMPEALATLGDWNSLQIGRSVATLLTIVLVVQFGFAALATFLPPIKTVVANSQGASRRVGAAAVMAWSATRSVIGLLIALAVPATLPNGAPFAERDLVLIVAALTIVGSVLLQGLTLRALVQRTPFAAEAEVQRESDKAQAAIEAATNGRKDDPPAGFDAARKALLKLRVDDAIGDEALLEALREVDLAARASEGNALPGAGPPNP